MIRRALRAAALCGLVLLLAACERPVPDAHLDYVGHWRGENMLLVISADGHGDYERVSGRERVSIEGPVHGFDEDGFRIGIGPLSAGFEVQSPPTRGEDGRWRMTVDGVELMRVDILPIGAGRESLSL